MHGNIVPGTSRMFVCDADGRNRTPCRVNADGQLEIAERDASAKGGPVRFVRRPLRRGEMVLHTR